MTNQEKTDYDALAGRLTGDALVSAGTVRRGDAATAAGRDLLLREYGSDEAIAHAIGAGRPRVGDSRRGASPTVRGRIADEDYSAFKELEVETGKKQSELVREAIHLLLQQHHKIAS